MNFWLFKLFAAKTTFDQTVFLKTGGSINPIHNEITLYTQYKGILNRLIYKK